MDRPSLKRKHVARPSPIGTPSPQRGPYGTGTHIAITHRTPANKPENIAGGRANLSEGIAPICEEPALASTKTP